MAKFLFVYHGGKAPTSEAEGKAAMAAWGAWFGSMGAAVVDGGNPVGKSSTVHAGGTVTSDGGSNPASGYSLINASSLSEALALAKGCPVLAGGGSVEVAEAMAM